MNKENLAEHTLTVLEVEVTSSHSCHSNGGLVKLAHHSGVHILEIVRDKVVTIP